MYATDKPFNRVHFGVKTNNNVNPASIDTTLFMPSYAGYSSSISLTSSVNPTGYGVINVFPTGTVTDLSGSGTLCRIKFDKNIFDRDELESGKIFACPPLGGDDSSRELIIPDLYNREDLSKRAVPYSSYTNQKLAIHLRSDEIDSGLTDDNQAFVIDVDYEKLAFDTRNLKYEIGTLDQAFNKHLVQKVINPYEVTSYYYLTQSVDAAAAVPIPKTRNPYIYTSGSYRHLALNSDTPSFTTSYVRGQSSNLAAANASREVTVLVVFKAKDSSLSTNEAPEHIFGTDYFDGAGGTIGTNSKMSLRLGKGSYDGNGGGGATDFIHAAPFPTVMPETSSDYILEFHLSGSAAGASASLYHKFEDVNDAQKTHIFSFRHKYDTSGATNENLYGPIVGSGTAATPDIAGEMRVDGAPANIVKDYDVASRPWTEADPFSNSGFYTLGAIARFDGSKYNELTNNGLDFPGCIAEVLVFTEAISPQSLEKLEGYLAHKWDVQNELPSDHPYKEASTLYEILGETETLAKELEIEFDDNPRYSTLLSDRAGAVYTSEKVCIKHNTDPVTKITGGVYRAPGTYYPGYTPATNPKTDIASADLVYWIDPTDASTITQTTPGVGNTVTSITEKALDSGIALATPAGFQQGTAGFQPTLQTVNGLNMLLFDGNDDYMNFKVNNFVTNGTLGDLSATGTFEMFIVFQSEQNTTSGGSSANTYSNTHILGDTGGYYGPAIYGQDTATPSLQVYVWDSGLYSTPASPGESFAHSTVHQVRFTNNGTSQKYSLNGGTESTVASGGPSNLAGALQLATGYTSGNEFQGYIGEILIYNGELSGADRTLILTYLDDKWDTPYT
jgi:hypothetical protein